MAAMINRFSIVTLIFFIISISFVIKSWTWRVRLPWGKKREVKIVLDFLTAPIIVVLILWASQCIDAEVIRNGIVGTGGIKPFNILILFFSLAYLAISLDLSGILEAAAYWVSNMGGNDGRRLFLYFYLLLLVFSVFLGNDPVILTGTVFLVYYTRVAQIDHVPWIFAEFAAANTASMVFFIGNPTNVVVTEAFGIKNIAFSAYTVFPFIACSIVSYIALRLQFAHRIDKVLPGVGKLDPLSALSDPVGAIVGTALLGGCLAVLLGVSFVPHIDVWEITLPFAVAKFIWDIVWDRVRAARKTLPKHRNATLDRKAREAGARVDDDDDEPSGEQTPNVEAETHRQAETRRDAESGHVAEPRHDTATSASRATTGATLVDSSSVDWARKVALDDVLEGDDNPVPEADGPPPLSAEPAQLAPSEKPPQRQRTRTRTRSQRAHDWLRERVPTFAAVLPRLPFALVPFAFTQFMLVEALAHTGWVSVFGHWLSAAGRVGGPHGTAWLVGVLGIVLCNLAGTNIGATILLAKIVVAASLDRESERAAAIALALASNIGAASATFAASLAGLLWRAILQQKEVKVKQTEFAKWNALPLAAMTVVGLAVVSIEVAVMHAAGI